MKYFIETSFWESSLTPSHTPGIHRIIRPNHRQNIAAFNQYLHSHMAAMVEMQEENIFSSLLFFSSIICTWTSLCLLISLDFCFCLPFYPSLLLGHLLCICLYACCNWSLFPEIGCGSDACLSSHSLSSLCSALLHVSDQNPVKGIGCIRSYRQKRKTAKAWGELGRAKHGSSAV